MERTLIAELKDRIGQEVCINGWVSVQRRQGKMVFFDFRDRSGIVQGVVLPNSGVSLEAADHARTESVVAVDARVNKRPDKNSNPTVPNGDIELEIKDIRILSRPQELPFELDTDVNLDIYLDYLPYTLRARSARAVFTVQAEILRAYRTFLNSRGFIEFQAPKLIGDDAEGSGAVYEVPYFNGKTAHLATSPQLYKQIMVGAFERVFSSGIVFRAEKHATSRHLNEYTSLDLELGFIADHRDIMNLETDLLRFITQELEKNCAAEFTLLGARFPAIPEKIPAMKLREAQELIFKETGKDSRTEPDLEPEDERWLSQWAAHEHDSDFIFVTHYPISKRPFYTMEDEHDKGFTKSFDLLFRGVEITTGGERRHDYDNLVEGAQMKGLDPEKFSFYLQAFKYGMPPHGGLGMGLERLTQKFLGLDNVKEATLFPRDLNRIDTLLSK